MSSDDGGGDENGRRGSSSCCSVASSMNSEDYGVVARSGFTRMYVLSHSSLSPIDQSCDYQSEAKGDDDDAAGASDLSKPRFQLVYGSGSHYFHGTISLPDGVGSPHDARDEENHDAKQREREDDDILMEESPAERRTRGVGIEDLPLLLPHFQKQHDAMHAVDSVTEFRTEMRDVIYHMEEVGEFMIEELAKEKVIARIEAASKELQWIASSQNPTFFEVQTSRGANDDLEAAGVVLIVMKIAVRGVLLDVIYFQDSYFVTLRENSEELSLDDTFVPNGTDDDINKLLLWCALPVDEMTSGLMVEGRAIQTTLPLQPSLASIITPMTKPSVLRERTTLDAIDTQMYCLLPSNRGWEKKQSAKSKKKNRKKQRAKLATRNGDNEEEEDDREALVVFQFNQYVYHGNLWMCPSLLDDLAKLSSHVFPHLRAQSHSLAFYGETQDLPRAGDGENGSDDYEDPTGKMQQFAGIRARFDAIAPTLLTLLLESQAWIQDFLTEVDAVVAADAKHDTDDTKSSSSEWLASHLKAWLELDEGMEAFFELELGSNSRSVFGECDDDDDDDDGAQVELVVWKGTVHAAIMVVVYRKGSFYMTLHDRPSEGDAFQVDDATELFGALPPLGSKGRGYLVRKFPLDTCSQEKWLAGAKLLLWQTSASLAREELAEAKLKARVAATKAPCADWFEADEDAAATADAKEARSTSAEVRGAQRTDEKQSRVEEEALVSSSGSSAKGTTTADKVSRRHHIPPLSSAMGSVPRSATAVAPWDLRTGRPI